MIVRVGGKVLEDLAPTPVGSSIIAPVAIESIPEAGELAEGLLSFKTTVSEYYDAFLQFLQESAI